MEEGKGEGTDTEEMRNKLGRIERRIERQEREERRKNIIIKGLKVKNGKRREAIEEVLNKIGTKVEIREIRKIGTGKEEGEEMVVVKVGGEEQKREIMRKKGNLKGRGEKILEDWTWKERKMRWNLERIAEKEERKGNKVGIGYGKIWINGKWWKWDEDEEVLRDGKGNRRREEEGEDRGREVEGAN